MKLILTSSNSFVTKHWIEHLGRDPHKMKLTFIPTAAEVEKGNLQWLKDDRQALVDAGFTVTDFTVTNKNIDEINTMLSATDMVFLSGGNTFYLLKELRRSGFASVIKAYLQKGLIYGGSSAGSLVAGPDIEVIKYLDESKFAPALTDYRGLCLTDVVTLPHWGSKHFENRYNKAMKACYKKGKKIILLTDDQYLFVNDESYQIMSI